MFFIRKKGGVGKGRGGFLGFANESAELQRNLSRVWQLRVACMAVFFFFFRGIQLLL